MTAKERRQCDRRMVDRARKWARVESAISDFLAVRDRERRLLAEHASDIDYRRERGLERIC
jgi:hypothetical protein